MSKQDLIDFLICAVVALYGSAAKTLADNRDTGARGLALLWLLLINAIISGFCGLMAIPVAKMLHCDPTQRLFLAGMAGYMGIGFLTYLENRVKEKLNGPGTG